MALEKTFYTGERKADKVWHDRMTIGEVQSHRPRRCHST